MYQELINELKQQIPLAANRRHQLLFLIGNVHSYSFKQLAEQMNLVYLNVNQLLSQYLKDIPISKRTRETIKFFNKRFSGEPSKIYLLDHLEILFCPQLQIDPGALLENFSRNHILVIPWYGQTNDDWLIHAEPNHPEYFRYDHRQNILIQI